MHRDFAGGGSRPLLLRAVAVKFDAVVVGVMQVKGLAYAVIGGAVEFNAGAVESPQGIGQRGTIGIANREMKKPGGPRRRRRAAGAFPGVQADVMVVATGADEGRLRAEALLELEAEHAAIKSEGAIKVGDLEVNVTDADARIDGRR